MEKNWKGTKEKVDIDYSTHHQMYFLDRGKDESDNEGKTNAQLFTDALHTIQECDLMPSQLWDQLQRSTEREVILKEENTKLKEALNGLNDELDDLSSTLKYRNDRILELKYALGEILKFHHSHSDEIAAKEKAKQLLNS